ncbi:MAG: nitroreductase family protein [Candidatus Methanoperedens sp.]|nr:nitroreductase family protein [Candidatus Methanoperedens sp.]MCZ7371107.1 nitroreductase family protein [Candidatus Methanoperedens sp.]
MDVSEAVRNRSAVRQFKPELINDEAIGKILEAGRWAPSPFNTQPWEFIIIKDKETLKSISKFARYSGYLEAAPMAIAVVVPPVSGKFSWVESIGETRFAAAMAVQNMMLAAMELGIGTCWVSIERDKVGEILKVPKTNFVLTIIPVGYPEIVPQKHDENSRKRLEDMVFYDYYGKKVGPD